MAQARERSWNWRLAAAICAIAGAAHAAETVSSDERAAFVAELAKVYAESNIERGKGSHSVLEAIREYLRSSPFLAEYDRRMVGAHGPSCGGAGLPKVLEALVVEGDEINATHYLTFLMAKCPHRLHDDRALLADAIPALEGARLERLERYEQFVQEEKQLALKEERERRERRQSELAQSLKAEAEERDRLEKARVAEIAAREAAERERGLAAARADEERDRSEAARLAAAGRRGEAPRIAGTYRCGLGEDHRFLYLGPSGEAVELVSVGSLVLGYAGLYRVVGDRVTIRFVADNSWKVFATKYEQRVPDDFAWKRSGIASQKLMEFRVGKTRPEILQMGDPRTKMLMSGETARVKRPDCAKLEASNPGARSIASQARLAMRYVDREVDLPPDTLDSAFLSLGPQIESKKRKEMEWFRRAPGVLKMMATDRLLEELRESSDGKCEPARAALEGAASAAMGTINRIGDSELAKANPTRAEELSGRQLDPAFEEFLDSAGRLQCIMAEASAVGL